ncbi:MAG: HAMP domain-containing histidine kinase [Elusimicrobia bacterium]|nr:HAMP domain-containing histidine kinase [Elusimicrobiota bacterium]
MEKSAEEKKTAYLTHELRTPLTSIICALELLRDGGLAAPEGAKLIELALGNADRLKTLINEILDLSKIQNGTLRLSPVACDPAELARASVESLLPWARRKGIHLSLKASVSCGKVYADPRRTSQVLLNLVSNAIKFTPDGGTVEVSLEPGRRDRAGNTLVCVKDSGPGIAPQDLARLFRYFVQAGPEDRRAEGSGLGLALSRSLVELQGGEMWAESALGKGASFFFSLPVHVEAQNSEPQARVNATKSSAAASFCHHGAPRA